jgi:quinoprotein glucose dehydrogenase
MLRPSRLPLTIASLAATFIMISADRAPVEWLFWGGDPGSAHYSKLADINSGNVAQLRQAWVWKTGETELKEFGTRPGMFENTPVVIENVMYVTTPYNKVVALDSEKGSVLWSYDPKSYVDGQPANGTGYVHRGIAIWRDAHAGNQPRIFLNTRYRLISLDAKTGQPVNTFGDNGVVDLSQGLVWQINKMHYTETSPPVVYKDLVIVGNGVGDRLVYKNDPRGAPSRRIG